MSTWAIIDESGWGGALAKRISAAGGEVLLWREPRSRKRYGKSVKLCTELAEVLQISERIVLATPVAELPGRLRRLAPHLQGHHRVLTTARGLTSEAHLRPTEAVQTLTAAKQTAVLAGAAQPGAREPGALVVGSAFPAWSDELQAALSDDTLRVYTNPDPIGVELSNALASVLGVAMGAARSLKVGSATEATALTRAMAEMDRLVRGLGGRPNTAYGLAGLGTLTTLVFAGKGASFEAGVAVAEGRVEDSEERAELVECARTMAARAATRGLRAPMVDAVCALLSGKVDARAVLGGLMSRASRSEGG